jgi:UDP-N-acetylglucosamine diphosphorylase / glucose-1-phosphate thymidylyltransferase / UDP-N-acetylgalactosamine diphosphorylase / glucosamine-1-phosphate N-acetyltransferase / galactosamine-1-phosphate N-acetyltransferase
VFHEYRIDGMIDVARKVMGRRKVALASDYEAMLREVFAMTRGSRVEIAGGRAEPAHPARIAGAAAELARAEALAIEDFEVVGESG